MGEDSPGIGDNPEHWAHALTRTQAADVMRTSLLACAKLGLSRRWAGVIGAR